MGSVVLPISAQLDEWGFREFNDYIYGYRTAFGLPRVAAIVNIGGVEYHIGFTQALTQIVRKGGLLVGLSQMLQPSTAYIHQGDYINAPVPAKLPAPYEQTVGFTTVFKTYGFFDSVVPYIHIAEFRDQYVMHFITEAIMS